VWLVSKLLILCRGFIIFGGMILWMLGYAISIPILGHSDDRAFRLRRSWLKNIAIPTLNIHVTTYGSLPDQGNYLFVSNHRSFSDPVVLCCYLDAFVVAKAEVAKYPIINRGAELTGVLYVKREEKSSRSEVREQMVETLNRGKNILVYPEGTVSKLQNILPYREGSFHMAAEHNFSVVPIAIEYRDTKDIWLLPPFLSQVSRQFSAWRTEVKLSFGQPMINSDGDKLHETVETWTRNEVNLLQKDWSRAQYQNG
jgi:1-acyl-sn-glycerol-3-phosphate acyltransferase